MVKGAPAPVGIRKEVPADEPQNDKIERMRKEESKLVKGIFQDNELKNGSIKFSFKKYRGDPIMTYELKDGEEYELPLSVVRHLNNDCAYHDHHFILDSKGNPTKSVRKTHRFSFKPLEYI
jgi:hypothetical protein